MATNLLSCAFALGILVVLVTLTSSTLPVRAPAVPANATLYKKSPNKPQYEAGEKLFYRCLPGFVVNGIPIRECRDGNWTPVSFLCSGAKICRNPGKLVNGRKVMMHSSSAGRKVRYSCNYGHRLHGDRLRICMRNKTWSGRKPECKVIDCGALATPSNGEKVQETGTTWKRKVVFRCTKRRYVLSGTRVRTCLPSGKWSGSTTYCRAPCSNPGWPAGGTKSGRNHRHGGQIRISCPATHRVQGETRITCHDGKWSAKLPSCALRDSDRDFTVCGINTVGRQRRMTGSQQSFHGTWPWQIGLYRPEVNGTGNSTFLCGGAVISERWVVTAAHCFTLHASHGEKLSGLFTVKVGDHHMSRNESSEQEVRVEHIFIHPDYKNNLYENDIALVELSRSVELGDYVRKVCLPRKRKNGTIEDIALLGKSGFVAGWGSTKVIRAGQELSEDAYKISQVLRHASFKIQGSAVCRSTTSYHFNSSVTFCAGSKNAGVDICKGDSGGPFVRKINWGGQKRWVAAGLVSWSEGCGIVGRFAYYTRLAPYVQWINKTIKKPRWPKKKNKGKNK